MATISEKLTERGRASRRFRELVSVLGDEFQGLVDAYHLRALVRLGRLARRRGFARAGNKRCGPDTGHPKPPA